MDDTSAKCLPTSELRIGRHRLYNWRGATSETVKAGMPPLVLREKPLGARLHSAVSRCGATCVATFAKDVRLLLTMRAVAPRVEQALPGHRRPGCAAEACASEHTVAS